MRPESPRPLMTDRFRDHAWAAVVPLLFVVFWHHQISQPLLTPERNDLKHLYLGSRLLLDHQSPYSYENLNTAAHADGHPHFRRLNPYVYPPFTGYLFGWISLLDYDQVRAVWFWFGQGCLVLAGVLFWGAFTGLTAAGRLALLVGAVAFSFPLYRSSTAGQLNHVLVLLLAMIMASWRNGFKRLAGVLIGFAALVKVLPGFLALWLVWKREWGTLAIVVITVAVLVLLPATVFGLDPYFEYFGILRQMGFGQSTWPDQGMSFHVDPGNIGVPALFYRLFTDNPVTTPWKPLPTEWVYGFSLVWALLVLVVCAAACRRGRLDEDPEMEIAVWTVGMLLIPSLFWDHYITLMLPFWWLLVARLLQPPFGAASLWLAGGCWAWCSLWIVWFRPEWLSGVKMLVLNQHLPAVVLLFLQGAYVARTGSQPRATGPDAP